MLRSILSTLLLLALFNGNNAKLEYKIIPPKCDGTARVDVGLVVLPGAYLQVEQYESLARMIQSISASRIWLCMAGNFRNDMVGISEAKTASEQCKKELIEAGLPENAKMFGAGHSQGGVSLNAAVANKDILQGIVLWAAYIGEGKAAKQVTPTLTLSGTLDGQTRMTLIARRFNELLNMLASDSEAIFRLPVIVHEGVNHAMFATGEMPSLVQKEDIPSELDDVTGKKLIAQSTASFIDYHAGSKGAGVLAADHQKSAEIFKPILEMFNLERTAEKTSPWVEKGQAIMSSIEANDLVNVKVKSEYLSGLGFQWSKSSIKTADLGLDLYVPCQKNKHNGISSRQSMRYIDAKFRSTEGIQESAKKAGLNLAFGEKKTCKDINEAAWEQALNSASDVARQRFTDTGIKVTFEEDSISGSGPTWLLSNLKFQYKDGNLTIQSTALNTDEPDWLPGRIANNNYCNLLSPAWAIEYIYVDALKEQ